MIDITRASPRPSQEYRPGSAHSPLHWPRVTPASSKLVKIPKSVALFDKTFTTYHYTNSSSPHFQLMCFFPLICILRKPPSGQKGAFNRSSGFKTPVAGTTSTTKGRETPAKLKLKLAFVKSSCQGWRGFKG